ncbi:S1C family serine protease [Streptomyces sp. NBC_01537]|uniref:S1C family serine protease n=1 Tax=Streptomyces sp. NBC_01537 TaxID=2903896 RepID=UPI00386ACEA7
MSTENEVGPAPAASESPAPSVTDAEPQTAQLPAVPPAPPMAPPAPPVAPAVPASAPAPVPAAVATAEPPAPSAYGAPAVPAAPAAAFGAEAPPAPSAYGAPAPLPASPGGPEGPVWGAPVPGAPAPAPKKPGNGGLVAAVLVAALLAGGVGGGVGYWAADRNSDNASSSTTVTTSGSSKDLSRASTSVAAIAKKALPSVVTIEATGSSESGTGTGFVFDKQGHILTNNHVVAPAADGGKLTATFSDGKKYTAEVVGRASGYDVAVIKLKGISADKLTPLALGDSDATAVGDATIAIGAPFGLSGTVTTGIVSAMHRPVASSDGTGASASYMSAIQTDASINPGNSGGPLLNGQGAVIGIDSAIQSTGSSDSTSQSGSIGLGFAIPINQAKRVAQDLIKTGQPVYPVIGVSVDSSYTGEGAKISTGTDAITSGGPAAVAGLQAGDIITKFDDAVIDSSPTLIAEIWQHEPGEKVTLTYTRSGQSHTVSLTLGERKGDSTS